MAVYKQGSRGEDVKALQTRLGRLGFKLEADGQFGKQTEAAVLQLQKLFGYNADGIVGDATSQLIDQQIGFGWNVNAPDAAERAAAANPGGTAAKKKS